jgi:hypothetical protein
VLYIFCLISILLHCISNIEALDWAYPNDCKRGNTASRVRAHEAHTERPQAELRGRRRGLPDSEANRVQISVPSCPAMASPYAGAQPASPAAAGHHTPAAAAAGQQNHLLAFRVMRLSRPSLQPDRAALLRFDPHDVFLPEDALTSPDPSAAADYLHRLLHPADAAATVPGDFSFRDRFLLRDSADALALPGLLVLPQSFGFASSSQFPFFGESCTAIVNIDQLP